MSARLRLLTLLAVVVPLGFGAKLYAGPGAYWIGAYGAGLLYVVFWILLVLLARPDLRPARVALAVLAVTCALEILQLWHPPALEGFRASFLGAALIGSTFAWGDFPPYVAGAVLGAWLGRAAVGWGSRPASRI